MNKEFTAEQGLGRLLRFWIICIGVFVAILLFQSFGEHYGSYTFQAWSWFWANTIPVVSILIGPFVFKEKLKLSEKIFKRADYRLIFLTSGIYVFLLLVSMVLEAYSKLPPDEIMGKSYIIFAPFQGIICGLEGILLVKT